MSRMRVLCALTALALLSGCIAVTEQGAAGQAAEESAPAETDWRRAAPPADLPTDRALSAGFLIVDGVYNTELTAPTTCSITRRFTPSRRRGCRCSRFLRTARR